MFTKTAVHMCLKNKRQISFAYLYDLTVKIGGNRCTLLCLFNLFSSIIISSLKDRERRTQG